MQQTLLEVDGSIMFGFYFNLLILYICKVLDLPLSILTTLSALLLYLLRIWSISLRK